MNHSILIVTHIAQKASRLHKSLHNASPHFHTRPDKSSNVVGIEFFNIPGIPPFKNYIATLSPSLWHHTGDKSLTIFYNPKSVAQQ